MADSWLTTIAKQKGLIPAQAFKDITKPSPKIAASPPAKLPSMAALNKVTPDDVQRGIDAGGGMTQAQILEEARKRAGTSNVNDGDPGGDVGPRIQPPVDAIASPSPVVVPKPAPAPVAAPAVKFAEIDPAAMQTPDLPTLSPPQAAKTLDLAPAPVPQAEVGPVQPQTVMDDKPQGIDWNKVGEIAKATGGSILGVLQAAVAGRTAGLAGRAFNPLTDTVVGANATRAQEQANQKDLLKDQFGFQATQNDLNRKNSRDLQAGQLSSAEKLQVLDQDFRAKQEAIARDAQAKQVQAEHQFQLDHDQASYAQRMKEIAAEGDQQLKQLRIQRDNALDVEKLRLGMPVAGVAAGAGDVANLGAFLPGGSSKR